MKRGTPPTIPSAFLDIKLAFNERVKKAVAKLRAAGRNAIHTVDLSDLSVRERDFALKVWHLPEDVDLPSYIEKWIVHQQRFGQPRLDDYLPDLAAMLGQPEMLWLLGNWAYPETASTGPKPAYSGSKAAMCHMGAFGISPHVNDSVAALRGSREERDVFAWAFELGARLTGREGKEPPFRMVAKPSNVYRHMPKLSGTLGRRAMEANVRMLRSLDALYPHMKIGRVGGVDGTAVAAWCPQRKSKDNDHEAKLRARATHAGFRFYSHDGGKHDVVEGEAYKIEHVKAWRGYYLVVLVDYCTGRPIVWTLMDASHDEAKALKELLRLLFEFWPDCPLETIVGDGAWDEDWAHELCERYYGIHLVASRTNETRLDAKHHIADESDAIAYFDGRGQAFCRAHRKALKWVGNAFANREGLAPGEPAPETHFRLRFKCEDGCGTPSMQMREHWTAFAYYPHTPFSKRQRYAERHALLDHRNVCESAFNALKVGHGLATVGADRLRLTDFDSVHALIDLSFCMGTALLLAQERDKLGVGYSTPPRADDQPTAAAA